MQPLSILLVASEVAPFAKTGGLADFSASLARYLSAAGHDVRLLMPMYRQVLEAGHVFQPHPRLQDVKVARWGRGRYVSFSSAPLPHGGPLVYFVRSPELYDRPGVYCQDGDEHLRFGTLTESALAFCQHLGWAPDVIHLNDWHTGLLPLQRRVHFAWDALFQRTQTLLTLHNLGFQGQFGLDTLGDLGLEGQQHLLWQEDVGEGRINFLRTGILYADYLTTVSETYAREIQGSEQGVGLDDILRQRADHLVGIVNGVDYGEWDPRHDPHIHTRFGPDALAGKRACRADLLEQFGLAPAEAGVPVIGLVSRLTAQKGLDLLPDALTVLLQREDVRLTVLGSGEERYESFFRWLHDTFPHHVGFRAGYSEPLAHRIEAGADMFLMPSRYEPCGLNQMYSLRYGTPPIVRRTGGLADTVQAFDPQSGNGTGFLFDGFTAHALLDAVQRALGVFRDPPRWAKLVQNGMLQDHSWNVQGPKYVSLYQRMLGRR